MKRTGELLKQAREAAKLSISEVALSTKINPKILVAIEAGESSQLPAKTFLKGFVRSYAQYLKLDIDEVMRVFNEETGSSAKPAAPVDTVTSEPAAPSVSTTAAPPRRRVGDEEEESASGLRTLAVAVIVVLIGLIIGVRELIEKYQKEKVIEADADLKVSPLVLPADKKPADEKSAAAADEKSEEKPSEKTEEKAEAKAEDAKPESVAEKPAEPAKVVEAPKPTEPPKPAEPAKPEVKPAEVKAAEVKPAEVKPAEETKPEATKPQKATRHEIIIEALDKVELKFQVKGESKRVSLGPTQVHTIFSDQPMTVDLSDGGAVNIILDGRERGVPGDLGKPKTIKIP